MSFPSLRNARRDQGYSLPEVLVVIAILGIVSVPAVKVSFDFIESLGQEAQSQVQQVDTTIEQAFDDYFDATIGDAPTE